MPVPARRHSRSRVRRRRAHDALKPKNVGVCSTCHAPVLPHRVCMACGSYKGKQVLARAPHRHDEEGKSEPGPAG